METALILCELQQLSSAPLTPQQQKVQDAAHALLKIHSPPVEYDGVFRRPAPVWRQPSIAHPAQ